MMNIQDFKPADVFRYFREIAEIPHGSYNLDGIIEYVIDFATSYGLF